MIVDSMRGATLADNRAYIFNKHREKYDAEFGDIVIPDLLRPPIIRWWHRCLSAANNPYH